MPLDAVVAEMLKQMADAGGPAMNEVSPAEARLMYQAMQGVLPKPDVSQVTDTKIGGVPARVYRVSEGTSPCIVYFHGGGWVIGDLETHDSLCRQLALAAGMTLIAVDYRLAPEHPFPAAIDDCYKVTAEIAANGDALGVDGSRIAVAGDSAGGNLSACVCLMAKDKAAAGEAAPDIAFQLLVYPVTDATMSAQSIEENAEGYLLTKASMQWFWDHYAGGNKKAVASPYASPINAEDLSGLPPACVITAEFDPLRDEGEAYAEKLKAAGVAVTLKRYDGMIHGFFGMAHLLPAAQDAMTLGAEQIKAALK